jgi:uncharacterized protein
VGLDLRVLDGDLAVARLAPDAPVPGWASLAPAGGGAPAALVAVVRTAAELSVVCAASTVPGGVTAERGWRALEVAGPLDLALTGVLSALLAPLADAGIAVFAIATYDTDYVLVRGDRLAGAVDALRAAGHRVAGG